MLTVRQHVVLALAEHHWKYPGARVAAIREQTGYGETRYHQVLNALIDTAAAEAAYPLLVRRLRRLRDARQRQRSARRLVL